MFFSESLYRFIGNNVFYFVIVYGILFMIQEFEYLSVEADIAGFNQLYESFVLLFVESNINVNNLTRVLGLKFNSYSVINGLDNEFFNVPQVIYELFLVFNITNEINIIDFLSTLSSDGATFFKRNLRVRVNLLHNGVRFAEYELLSLQILTNQNGILFTVYVY